MHLSPFSSQLYERMLIATPLVCGRFAVRFTAAMPAHVAPEE